jgi:hypothetical protein
VQRQGRDQGRQRAPRPASEHPLQTEEDQAARGDARRQERLVEVEDLVAAEGHRSDGVVEQAQHDGPPFGDERAHQADRAKEVQGLAGEVEQEEGGRQAQRLHQRRDQGCEDGVPVLRAVAEEQVAGEGTGPHALDDLRGVEA